MSGGATLSSDDALPHRLEPLRVRLLQVCQRLLVLRMQGACPALQLSPVLLPELTLLLQHSHPEFVLHGRLCRRSRLGCGLCRSICGGHLQFRSCPYECIRRLPGESRRVEGR